jgi:hypothetical protein
MNEYLIFLIGFLALALALIICFSSPKGTARLFDRAIASGTLIAVATAAVLSQQANQINRLSFSAVQRAFVTVVDLQFEATTGNDGRPVSWMFTPIIENSGTTPTVNMKITGVMTGGPTKPEKGWSNLYPSVELPRDPSDPYEVYYLPEPFRALHVVLGPKARMPLPLSASGGIGVDLLQNVIEHDWQHSIYGTIHYYDVFPDSVEHITKFCFALGAEKTSSNEIKPRYGYRGHWNCADSECASDRDNYRKEIREAFAKVGQPVPPEIVDRWQWVDKSGRRF